MALEKTTRTIDVKVNPSYPIVIGHQLSETIAGSIKSKKLAIISDNNVKALHLAGLTEALKAADKTGQAYAIEAGEKSKSFASLQAILSQMAQDGFDRQAAIIALGGGIVGDLAGFAAACFMRGIDFYQVPTSLLAMVDASVGGKTGINLPEGKNLVGAFWQPKAVFIDVSYLKTLPETEFRQGAVELFKHGLIRDQSMLSDVQKSQFHKDGDSYFLTDLIARSVQVKADIVTEDEKETGVRAYLNLGHSLAHALEAASDHRLPHGDAVAYGLVFASRLAAQRSWQDLSQECLRFLRWLSPKALPSKDFSQLEPYLQRDKKNKDGKLRFVLLKALGQPLIVDDLSPEELLSAWNFLVENI